MSEHIPESLRLDKLPDRDHEVFGLPNAITERNIPCSVMDKSEVCQDGLMENVSAVGICWTCVEFFCFADGVAHVEAHHPA